MPCQWDIKISHCIFVQDVGLTDSAEIFFEGRAGIFLLSSFLPPFIDEIRKANTSSIRKGRHLAPDESAEYGAKTITLKDASDPSMLVGVI